MSALTTLVSFIVFFLSLSAFAQNLPPDIPNEHSNNLSFNLPFGTTSFTFEIFPAVDPEGDNITYELLSSPSMGMISGCFSGTSSTTCTYTPYFSGVFESFSYRATDGNGYSQNINISIMDFGALPVTMKGPQTVKALMDTPSKFIVLGGQSNQYLYFETTTQPQHGTLSNCFGNNIYSRICTYTPDPGFTGLDSFTYRGSDYFSNSANQTVTFEILPVNNLPELSGNLSLTTTENSSLNIKIIKGIDADSDNIFYQVTSLPQNGSLSSCFNSLVDTEFSLFCNYKPDPGYIGVDSFTVVANDGKQNSNTSFTINLNVQSQNNAPTVGANQSVSLDEDSSINFTVNVGTDPDNDDLQYSIYSYPSNGSLSNCLKNNLDNSYSRDCTYTPNEDFNGVDSMSYRVTDLQNTSSTTATVTFTTNSINDAPIMLGDSSTFIQVNQPTYVTLPAATDADGDSLVYYLITQPSHGIIQDCLQGTDDLTCAYFPDQDFTGVDTITYKANDGVSDSVNISYYALRVGVTNDEPDMVGDQSFNGYENTELFFTLNGATDSDNDPLNYHIISSPDSGTLSDCLNNTGDLTCRYIPDPSFIGTVTFTYKANDGVENSTVYSTVTLNILNTNDAPIIGIDQNFSVNEDELLSFNISPATDLDGDYLTYEIVSPPSSGLVYGCANGTGSTTCFYQPDENFSGSVSFTYKASDGSLDSANFATVSIEVLEVNDLPVMISDQSFSGNEDTTFSFILNGATDSDSGTLIYSVVSPPSNGSLSNCLNETSSLNCDFTPGPNFNGQITFSYKANDGVSDSVNTSTVTLTINPVNDAPIMAANQSFIVNEDTPVNFTINAATDIEGDTLTYSIVDISDDPNAGVVSDCLESNGDLTCTYTPAGNISGEFSFDYIANDGQLNALTKAMVTITVLPVNDVPEMIADQSIETNENTPVDFILNGAIDIDATDNLTYSVVTAPTNGVLSNCIQSDSDLSCTYTPSNNFSGVDTFTYQANDSVTNSSSVSTVTINVFALNSAPTFASTQSFETYEDTSLSFEVAPAQDLDEDLLTYTLVSSPAYGTLENCLEGNTDLICDYIPNGNYNGVDSFTYIASDGELTSEIQAQVLINVLAVNDRPVMNNLAENFQVLEDSTANIITLAGAVDIDGDSLTYSTVINPSHGTLSNCLQGTSGLNCEYTPNTNFSGAETFTYVASDGQEFALVESTVNISVIGSDDPPLIGANQSFTFNEDEVFQFNLNPGFDPEGSPVSYILTQPPSSGTLVGCLDGSLLTSCTYIPQENFNGAITFYYKVNDGSLDSTSFAQIDFNILPVNDAPELIASQSFSLPYSGGSFIVANATDVEGNILTYEITQNAQYGSVSNCLNNNGDLDCDYIPNAGFTGVDLFSYRAFDGDKYSSSSTVSITINPSNSAPVMIGDQTFEGEQDINLDFTAQGATDAEGNILSYSVVTAPQHGVLTNCLNSTSVLNCTYIPNPGFYGVDTFTYKANDGLLDSLTTSTITIDLIEANANPVLGANQSFSTSKNISFGFAVNMASDSDGDTLVYSIVSGPSNGTLSNCLQNDSDLSCTYTPNLDFVGSDSFTYKANDGIEDSIEVATVFITVNEINNPPVMIGNQSFETQEDVPANFAANGATDADGDVITYSTVTGPSHGTLTNCFNNTSNLECLYTPNSGYTGNDSFTYVAYDGKNNSISTSTITIQVSEVPDASIIQSIYIGAYQNCIENGGGIFRCWGQGGQGQLGIDSSINKNPQFSMEPVLITNNIEKLYMGERNACAILKNGDVKCWGKNWYGELGIDNTTSISTSVSTSILNSPTTNVGFPVKKLALGANFTCALSDDGLGRVRCWGLNSSGQLGYASSVVSTSQRVGDGNGITIQDAGDLEIGEPIADIFASSSFHCMLSVAGNVYCTNLPSYGNPSIRVGVFQTPQQAGPIPIGGTVINMGLGSSHACALLSSGSVRCWGNGSRGQLGINTTGYYGDDEQPLTVPTINFGTTASIVKLQGGNDATCALFSNKKMKCWGDGTTRGLNGQGIGQNVGDGVGPSVASVPFIDMAMMLKILAYIQMVDG
jgi:alpha-tubulin suppressor-like RCC1 family protein